LREKNAYVECGGKDDDVCEIPSEVRKMMGNKPVEKSRKEEQVDNDTEDTRILKSIIAPFYTYRLTKTNKK
jgi:hypothetical protein